ncbi:MAG: fimbria/pilus outer membrane usher protein [Acidobacteriia bacterium]|nr:fimbria/pilus outer membrane usher protein [Terriglobia bacterium]
MAAKVGAEDSASDAAADLETEEGPQSAHVGQRKKPEARKQPLAPGEVVVAVELNGNPVDDFAQVFRDGKGQYFATAELFSASRLPVPKVTPTQVQEILYYPLSAIPGLTYQFDTAQQKLAILVPPSNLTATLVGLASGTREKAMNPEPGFFLNHDFQVSGSNAQYNVSGFEELGFFSKLGVLTTKFVGQDLTHSPTATRLDSQFVRDFPERMATLTIGDGFSASSPWGRVVNYAGVRWGSKFATQPSFIPFALPTIAGQAAQPSTVDLYVNNVRTSHQNVDAGPFAIHDIPTITPQGDVRMVITDLTGRQQVVSMAFISTPQLLKKGVSDYSYEAGTLRTGFGLKSFGYQSWFVEGTHARGLTDSLTVNLRGEVQAHGQTFGAGFEKGLLPIGLFGVGAAVSRSDNGGGGLVYAHLQHATRAFSFSASAQATTKNFQQLGLAVGEHATRFVGQAQVSRAISRRATVAVAYLRQEKPGLAVYDRDGKSLSHFNSVSPGLTIGLPRGTYFVLSGYYAPELKQRASASMSLMIPLGGRRTVVASTGYQEGKTSPSVEYTEQAPMATGWGHRVRASSSNDLQAPEVDAGATYQSRIGTYLFEAGQQKGTGTSWRLGYSGGTVLLHRRLELTRSLTDGFAVVDASGTPGIRVLVNNQYIGTTDRHGLAIVPNLPAYNNNVIALDDKDLSLDLDVDLSQKTVVPMPRSGLFINFEAKPNRGAVLKLVTEDGSYPPVGAVATINGGQTAYEVVLRGDLFVPEISFPARVRVHWDDTTCQATVPAPENAGELLPRIGPITCRKLR